MRLALLPSVGLVFLFFFFLLSYLLTSTDFLLSQLLTMCQFWVCVALVLLC